MRLLELSARPVSSRSSLRARRLTAAIAVALSASPILAAPFIYTAPNTTNTAPGDSWSAGTNWTATPVSAADTTLTFNGPTTSGITRFTTNDTGTFSLNTMTLAGTGPNGATATMNIAGNPLQFPATAASPTINLNASLGTGTSPGYNWTVANALILDNNLLVTGDGTAAYGFTGIVSGTGSMTKSGTSAFGLGGANTFVGGFTLTAGTVRLSAASVGSVGAITSSPIGTGPLALNGGTMMAGDATNARTILNPVTVGGNVTLGSTTNSAALTFAADASLTGTRTLTVNSPVTYNGNISSTAGTFGLTKAGGSTLVLNGTNTYGGPTVISGGVLQFNSPDAIGGSGVDVTINGAGAAAAAGTLTPTALLARVVTTSAGTLALNTSTATDFDFTSYPSLFLGANATVNYTGTLTPVGGAYRLGGGGGTLTIANTNAITGANNLNVTAGQSGTVVLAAANNYTGVTNIGGTSVLRILTADAIANSPSVSVANGGRLELGNGVTVSGKTITINGAGGNNLGALSTASTAGIAAEWAGPVIVGSNTARIGIGSTTGTLTVSGVIDDGMNDFGIQIRNPDASVDTAAVVLTAANTYGGPTAAVTGTTRIDGGDNRLPIGTTLTIGLNTNTVAQFDLNGRNQQVAGLLRAGAVASNKVINTKADTLSTFTVASDTVVSTYSGPITDTNAANNARLALTKAGTSIMTLSGANNGYSGGTTIAGGTIAARANGTLGSGNVSIIPTASANSILDLSSSVTTGAIADSANLLLFSDTSTATTRYGQIAFGSSTLNETVNGLLIDNIGMPAGSYTASNLPNHITGSGTVTVLTTIPEPATLGVLSLAGAGLLLRRRRR